MAVCVLVVQAAVADHGLPLVVMLMISIVTGAVSYAALVLFVHRRKLPAMLASWRGEGNGLRTR
jgi:hypothetical protein